MATNGARYCNMNGITPGMVIPYEPETLKSCVCEDPMIAMPPWASKLETHGMMITDYQRDWKIAPAFL